MIEVMGADDKQKFSVTTVAVFLTFPRPLDKH